MPEKKATPAAKSKKGKKVKCDPVAFAEVLMEVCKVLMTVCDTVTYFAEEELSMVTIENFSEHGRALLEQLPAEARLPMIRVALIYKQEIESEDPPFYIDEEDDDLEDDPIEDEEEDEAEGEDDDEDDEDDEDETMRPEHFYEFKRFFTEEEAAALVEGAEEGGALAKAVDATLDSLVAADEEEAKEADEDEDEEEEEEEDEDDHMLDPEHVKWKGA